MLSSMAESVLVRGRSGEDDDAAGPNGMEPEHADMKHDDIIGEAVPEMEELSVRETIMMLVSPHLDSHVLVWCF